MSVRTRPGSSSTRSMRRDTGSVPLLPTNELSAIGWQRPCPLVGLGRWQGNRKRTPGTGSRGHSDPAAVDLSDERETEPVAVHLTGNGVSAAIEGIEDVRQLGSRDAPAVIAHGDPDLRPTTLTTMFDLDAHPTIAATADGIGDQVLHYRSKSSGVSHDHRRILHEIALDRDVLGLQQGDGALDRAFDDLGGRKRHSSALDEPRLDSCVLQHALDHLTQAARFCFEKLPVSLTRSPLPTTPCDRFSAADRITATGAQLVRNTRDKLHLLAREPMRASRGRSQQRDTERQEQKHSEADRQVPGGAHAQPPPRAIHSMLDEQTPTPEIVNRSFTRPISERVAAESSAFIAARTVAHRRARRASKEKCLGADSEQRCRCVGAVRVYRCVWIRAIQRVARIISRDDRDAIDVSFNMRESAATRLQHLLADIRHVQFDDREAEHGRNGLRTRTRSPRDHEVSQRHEDQRILAAKHGSAIESPPCAEVPIFLLDLRAPFERGRHSMASSASTSAFHRRRRR